MNDMLKNMLVWIVIAVVIMSVFNNFIPQKEASSNLSYSEFITQVRDSQIESVLIEADGKTISGNYKNGTNFVTYGLNIQLPFYKKLALIYLIGQNAVLNASSPYPQFYLGIVNNPG
jgi:ATP-dependent Zn protease